MRIVDEGVWLDIRRAEGMPEGPSVLGKWMVKVAFVALIFALIGVWGLGMACVAAIAMKQMAED